MLPGPAAENQPTAFMTIGNTAAVVAACRITAGRITGRHSGGGAAGPAPGHRGAAAAVKVKQCSGDCRRRLQALQAGPTPTINCWHTEHTMHTELQLI